MDVTVILNPMAGQAGASADLDQALAYLTEQGWSLTCRESHAPGDAIRLAAEAARAGVETVIVVGGDGTLSEAANGLVGTSTALGVLPIGTGNVWAAQLGLVQSPTLIYRPDLLSAARALVVSRRVVIDMGHATTPQGERYFLFWAGVGLDAAIQRVIEQEGKPAKRRFGQWAYVWAALKPVLKFRGVRATVTIDGKRVRGRVAFVVVTNIQMYASVQLTPDARLNDGWLDICVFEGLGWLDAIRHIGQLAFRRHFADPQVKFYRGREISVQPEAILPVHYDGDPLASTPLNVRIVPGVLTVLIPPSAPADLFV